MTDKETYKKLIERFGNKHQMAVAIEECMELSKELTKAIRDKGNDMKIAEEIADVLICLEQVALMFSIDREMVSIFKEFKLTRLRKFYAEGDHK
jgi:NTP pyrophosphatase (non-canonical NTP hydrolase)